MRILLIFFTIIFSLSCNNKKQLDSNDASKKSYPETKTGFMLKGMNSLQKGDIIRVEYKIKTIDGDLKMTIPPLQEIDGIFNMEVSKTIEREVLDVNEGEAKKYKINIIKDIKIRSQKIAGNLNKKETPNPLTGKTIIGEKKSTEWSFYLEKGNATTEELEALKKIEKAFAQDNKLPYPESPIQVGETWEIPKSKLNIFFGGDSPIVSGSGSLKLIEILDYKNKKYARIAVSVNTKSVQDETGQTMEMSMKGQYYRDLEDFIDVDFDMKGQMKALGEVSKPDGSKISISLDGPSTMTLTKIINPVKAPVNSNLK